MKRCLNEWRVSTRIGLDRLALATMFGLAICSLLSFR